MINIRKAQKKDFNDIYKLIINSHSDNTISKDEWEKLFINHWTKSFSDYGFVLQNNKNIVGFLGTIFSERIVNDKRLLFCNLSTWVVLKEFRQYSLLLLFKVLKKKDIIITAFTASIDASKI